MREREKNRQEHNKDKIQPIYNIATLQTAVIVYNKGEYIIHSIHYYQAYIHDKSYIYITTCWHC